MDMDKDKRKKLELNIAIALGIILLVVVWVIFARSAEKKISVIREVDVKKEKSVSRPSRGMPPKTEEIEESVFLEKEEIGAEEAPIPEDQDRQEIMMLEDLPLDQIIEEEMPEETIEIELKLQPSHEDMKILKNKKLIIY